jgi:CRP/FNR family transcriptional regulator, cyclic AMP receptor protein
VLRKNSKIELFRRVPFFADCSKRELEEIALVADEMDFPAGKTLIKEGRPGREAFILVSGEVEVRRKGRRIAIRGGSEIFGEMALVTDQPRNATVTSVTPVHVLVVTDRAFRTVLQTTPSIAIKLLKSLAERLQPEVYEPEVGHRRRAATTRSLL